MRHYIDAWRNWVTFSGRATRTQFWMFQLILFIIMFVAGILDGILIEPVTANGDRFSPISAVLGLIHFLPALSILVRRLHDTDRSGAWAWALIVPLLNIVLLVFMFFKSSPGTNRFGPPVMLKGQPQVIAHESPYKAEQSTADRLEQLGRLRAAGTIDEAEFARLKGQVMQAS